MCQILAIKQRRSFCHSLPLSLAKQGRQFATLLLYTKIQGPHSNIRSNYYVYNIYIELGKVEEINYPFSQPRLHTDQQF